MKLFPKNVFISGIVLFWLTTLFAQAPDTLWTKTYGGTDWEEGFSVQQTADSGYVVVGGTRSFGLGAWDVYFIKTDVNGDTSWTKTYGGTDSDKGYSVRQISDGGYVIAGYTKSFGAGGEDVYLLRTDANGDTLWTKTYGGVNNDNGSAIQQTTDGGYIIVGETSSFGNGSADIWLLKTDANGDTVWTKTYGGEDWDEAISVQQTADSGYVIVGALISVGPGDADVWLIKTDVNGDTLWTKRYGGTLHERGFSLQQTSDKGYIIVGTTDSYGAGESDVWLIKTDSLGDTLWTKTYGGMESDVGHSVAITSDWGYIIAGYTESFGLGVLDFYLIKTDTSGDTLWTKTYGGEDADAAVSIQRTSDDGYIIVGITFSFGAGWDDVYLIKLAPDVGIEEEITQPIIQYIYGATIFSGPLLLPEGKECRVFDITGRAVMPDKIKPGIYFIEIDGVVTQKVVKIR